MGVRRMFNFFKKKDNDAAKALDIYAVCDGEIQDISEVKDEVFAQKMMGDGFAIVPDNGIIVAPVKGKVDNVFPTKHAFGIVTEEGLEILIHMGIDTVTLEGEPFETLVSEGAQVSGETQVSQVDLEKLAASGKDNVMIVVFTNGDESLKSIEINKTGHVNRGEVIGQVILN